MLMKSIPLIVLLFNLSIMVRVRIEGDDQKVFDSINHPITNDNETTTTTSNEMIRNHSKQINRSQLYSDIQIHMINLDISKQTFGLNRIEDKLSDILNPKLLIALMIQVVGVLGFCCFVRRDRNNKRDLFDDISDQSYKVDLHLYVRANHSSLRIS